MAEFLASLAFSKGKARYFFLLKGLEKVVNFMEVQQLIEQKVITEEQIKELFAKIGL
ncbi:MAG: hypothetical protein LH609_01885 [Rudanella sp.]|nr:hypothetical protein [Rudanella sp.]